MKNATQKLNEMIAAKELEKAKAEEMIRQNVNNIAESINPINIIKNSISDFFSSKNIINKIVGVAVVAGSGYFLKKIIEKNSSSIFNKITSILIEIGVINFITNNKEEIKTAGLKIIDKIFDFKSSENQSEAK